MLEVDKIRTSLLGIGPQSSLESYLRKMATIPEILALEQGRVLTGLTLKIDEEGWLIVYKSSKKGKNYVAFSGVQHWADLWEFITWELTNDQLTWRGDRYQ